MNTEQMAQMHEFITLLVSGIKKAELEAQLRPLLERFREAVVQELVSESGEPVIGLSTNDGMDFYTADQLAGAVLRERERILNLPQIKGNLFAEKAIRSGDVPNA